MDVFKINLDARDNCSSEQLLIINKEHKLLPYRTLFWSQFHEIFSNLVVSHPSFHFSSWWKFLSFAKETKFSRDKLYWKIFCVITKAVKNLTKSAYMWKEWIYNFFNLQNGNSMYFIIRFTIINNMIAFCADLTGSTDKGSLNIFREQVYIIRFMLIIILSILWFN